MWFCNSFKKKRLFKLKELAAGNDWCQSQKVTHNCFMLFAFCTERAFATNRNCRNLEAPWLKLLLDFAATQSTVLRLSDSALFAKLSVERAGVFERLLAPRTWLLTCSDKQLSAVHAYACYRTFPEVLCFCIKPFISCVVELPLIGNVLQAIDERIKHNAVIFAC